MRTHAFPPVPRWRIVRAWVVLAMLARKAWGAAWMRMAGIRVPRSCVIAGAPIVWGNEGEIVLGEGVRLFSCHDRYGFGWSFPACFLSAGPNGRIAIGDRTEIHRSALYAASSIEIGKRVLVAADCRIFDHDGHDVDSFPRAGTETFEGKPIVIEDDVWLGCGVTVCKGVRIGKGSVVAAESVVTGDIPPGVLAAGVPARVVRPLRTGEAR